MKNSYATIKTLYHAERRRSLHKIKAKRLHHLTGWGDTNPGFRCYNCGLEIHAEPFISGVAHRNHCPYCLWSRHLDLNQAGDRMCACKGLMRPVGLTVKQTHKRYQVKAGELMLIHLCVECEALSINRIAADDLPSELIDVFQRSLELNVMLRRRLDESSIRILGSTEESLVRLRLFGDSC